MLGLRAQNTRRLNSRLPRSSESPSATASSTQPVDDVLQRRLGAERIQAGAEQRQHQHAAENPERRAFAAGERHAADDGSGGRRHQHVGQRDTGGRRQAVAQQRAAQRAQHAGQRKHAEHDAVGANPGDQGGAAIAARGVDITPEAGLRHQERRHHERGDGRQAAQGQDLQDGQVDRQGHVPCVDRRSPDRRS